MRFSVSILCSFWPLIWATISPCAKWNTSGVTVVGKGVGSISDSFHDQLYLPRSIFFHKKSNTLYVSDAGRVQTFPLNGSSAAGSTLTMKSVVRRIFVDDDDDGPTLYATVVDFDGGHVEKWAYGASHGVQVGDQCQDCMGVWVDQEKNVYMTEYFQHSVLKWSPQTNTTTIVAGRTNQSGSTGEYLAFPNDIYVDATENAVYVSDLGNQRIQKWTKGAREGITIVGPSKITENNNSAWLKPNSIWIDEETNVIFVADGLYSGIKRWLPNASTGEIIAGGFGMLRQSFISAKKYEL
ncbi:unnamed protein product [Rotaria sp. Silwood2]|nr:unnamed protein product [Rotaria sp. Silwood2]